MANELRVVFDTSVMDVMPYIKEAIAKRAIPKAHQ